MFKELHERFMELREMLGDETMLDETVNWLGVQSLMELIEHIEEQYDFYSDDDEYDEEDCEDDDEYDEEDYGEQDDDDETGCEGVSEDCDGGIEFT